MKLTDGFSYFFNPVSVISNLLTLWGGGGGGKGGGKGDAPDVAPLILNKTRVNTGFGNAVLDPLKGKYTYTLDPKLAAMRDIFYGGAQDFVPSQAEKDWSQGVSDTGMGMFTRGNELLQQALGLDTRDIGQKYYSDVMGLQADSRAAEEARLADTLFRTGRTGAATSYGGGYLNPEQFALLKAREEANKGLAIQSEELGRQRRASDTGYATGLMQSGLGTYGAGYQAGATPYQTAAGVFGLGTDIEKLGMIPMSFGSDMMGKQLAAAMAMQQNQQAMNNAEASGGKGGGLLGGVVNAGLNYGLSGGFSNPFAATTGVIGGGIGGSWSPLTNYTPVGGPGVRLF